MTPARAGLLSLGLLAGGGLAGCGPDTGTPAGAPRPTTVSAAPSAKPLSAPGRRWPGPYSVSSKELPPAKELPPGTIRILVLGDSVASFLGVALRHRQEEARAFVAERGVGSCSIFEAKATVADGKLVEGTSCSRDWALDAAELRPDVTLLILGGAFLSERACEPAWLASYERRILDLLRAMGSNAGRVVLTRVPYPMGGWRYGAVLDQVECYNGMLQGTAKRARLGLLDLMSHVCPTRACEPETRGAPIRPDGLHFDGAGAEETARWVLRELRRIAGAPPLP